MDGRDSERNPRDVGGIEGEQLRPYRWFIEVSEVGGGISPHRDPVAIFYLIIVAKVVFIEDLVDCFAAEATKHFIILGKCIDTILAAMIAFELLTSFNGHAARILFLATNLFLRSHD